MSEDTLNNIGTKFIEVFAPLYILLTISLILVHYLRVHAIEPIIDFHVNRRTVLDFSAFLDSGIESIINATLPPQEQLIWADVSLKISRWRHLLAAIVCFVVGGVTLSILPHTPSIAPFLLPFFVLLTLPAFYMLGSGLHQLIKKKNYTHIYLLTTSGAIIVHEGWFGRKANFQWPYKCMVNIHSVHVMYKVASVFFAENWDIGNMRLLSDDQGSRNTPFKWKQSKVGFENIVKANDVEDLIRQQVTQLSPSSSRHVAYTL